MIASKIRAALPPCRLAPQARARSLAGSSISQLPVNVDFAADPLGQSDGVRRLTLGNRRICVTKNTESLWNYA